MARATICIAVVESAEVEAAIERLSANAERLDFLSENYGCGCCVDLYDVEGPVELLATIPNAINASSDWTAGKAKHRRPAQEV